MLQLQLCCAGDVGQLHLSYGSPLPRQQQGEYVGSSFRYAGMLTVFPAPSSSQPSPLSPGLLLQLSTQWQEGNVRSGKRDSAMGKPNSSLGQELQPIPGRRASLRVQFLGLCSCFQLLSKACHHSGFFFLLLQELALSLAGSGHLGHSWNSNK